jgi:hypothetical protein
VNFDVKPVGGIAVESVPEDVKKLVADKPLFPPEPPKEGWELLDIVEQRPAEAVKIVKSSRGEFEVKVVAEAVTVARNTMYKSIQRARHDIRVRVLLSHVFGIVEELSQTP